MITNRFEEWKERQRLVGVRQGVEQGIEQGRLDGERALVLRLIQRRFGEFASVQTPAECRPIPVETGPTGCWMPTAWTTFSAEPVLASRRHIIRKAKDKT